MLSENARVRRKILPIFANLFAPHLAKVNTALEPGLIHIAWTSLTFNAFVSNARSAVSEFELLIDKVIGVYENLITLYLDEVSCCVLCELPESEPLMTEDFLMQTQVIC